VNELEIDPARLPKILHYDGTPITARFITGAIVKAIEQRLNPSDASKTKQADQAAKAGSAA
jgi:2-oxoglutarate/2-oxoacid ferredoxin oxidoreductase subunit alpha